MKPLPASVIAALSCCLLAGVLVGATCLTDGLSSGQRVMTELAMPVGLAWLAAFAAMVYHAVRGNRAAACGLAATFDAVWVLFCPLLAAYAFRITETPPLPLSPTAAEAPRFTAVVVLGGGASRNAQGQAELSQAGERLALAAKMWHAGKVDAIVCTGTVKPWQRGGSPAELINFEPDDPAEVGREIFIALGVPQERIFRSPGQNTAAEMRHLVDFFDEPPAGFPAGQVVGVITGAYHLPRAMRLSKALDLQFEPLPAGASRKAEQPARRWNCSAQRRCRRRGGDGRQGVASATARSLIAASRLWIRAQAISRAEAERKISIRVCSIQAALPSRSPSPGNETARTISKMNAANSSVGSPSRCRDRPSVGRHDSLGGGVRSCSRLSPT